jgi:alpha-galactosidase
LRPLSLIASRFLLLLPVLLFNHLAYSQDKALWKPEISSLHIHYHIGEKQSDYQLGWKERLDTADLRIEKTIKHISGGFLVIVDVTPKRDLVLDVAEMTTPMDADVKTIFCNGFQSWSTSREYEPDEKIKAMHGLGKKLAGNYGDYNYLKYPAKKGQLHSWTYTYTRNAQGIIHLIGSLSEASAYTLIKHDAGQKTTVISKDCKSMFIKSGNTVRLFRLWIQTGEDDEVFKAYGEEFQTILKQTAEKEDLTLSTTTVAPAMGWTSWYNYYTHISRDTILNNLRAFRDNKIPIGFFQIDDGYQRATGDWLQANDKFPGGMKPIADSIHAAGYKAGLWLAPFICEKNSDIFKNHKEWLLKNDKGEPLAVGINPMWSGKYYAIDIYSGEFRKHLREVLDTVLNKWDYDLIKVDFLFAAAIKPPAGRTRGEVMTDAMMLLRRYSGDKLILGCGAPLGPAFQLTDYCRVSSDVHMKWEQKILKWIKARERLSTWNNLTTTIARWQLAGNMFQNDPDVFVLRDKKNKLNKEQRHTMLLVNNLFGRLIFTSDNISQYTAEQMQLYKSSFPYRAKEDIKVSKDGEVYTATFKIGDRSYLAWINLSGKSNTCVLDSGLYYDNYTNSIVTGKLKLKAYQTLCLYRSAGHAFEVLGGKGALFPGSEVKTLELQNDKNLKLSYNDGADKTQPLVISIPTEFNKMKVNGKEFPAIQLNGVHCLVYVP